MKAGTTIGIESELRGRRFRNSLMGRVKRDR